MMHPLYLGAILLSAAGVLFLNIQFRTGVVSRQLVRTVLITVPIFLVFDLIGSARGWFYSNPHLNLLILSPGIPIEEPVLLAFLTLVSVSLLQGARRVMR